MPFPQERTPQEKETLVFPNPEEASEFAERVEGRFTRENRPGIDQRKDIVAEEIAGQFERAGEAADVIRQPWEHSREEHEEAQELVDLAFAKDLPTALRKAKSSRHYPRNLDLFHDVLTGEMYKLLVENKINKQPLAVWILVTGIIMILAGLGLVVLVIFLV